MSNIGRVFFALLAAALTPTVIFFTFEFLDQARHFQGCEITHAFHAAFAVGFFTFGIAFLHSVFLGLPLFFVLKRLEARVWWVSLVCGFLIGLIPFAIFTWPGSSNYSYQAYDGTRMVDYVVDGVPTREGWAQYTKSTLGMGLLGMLSGFIAWLVWRFLPIREETKAAAQ